VAIIWKAGPQHWTLEGLRVLSANTISATLVSGTKRWLLLGTYLNLSDDPDAELDILEMEFHRHPSLPVILLGDLNTDINDTTDAHSIAIASTMDLLGVTDASNRFPQKNKRRYTRHHHLSSGAHHCSRCDYVLTDPMVPVKSIRIVIPPRFVSDHWAVKLQIHSSTTQEHSRYMHNRSRLPSVRPEADEAIPNAIFTELLTHHNRIPPPAYPLRDAWIARDTWTLIDQRNAALR